MDTVKRLMVTKRLALARDRHGCTPLHTAIIYEQSEIIRFIAAQFPVVLNAPDYVSTHWVGRLLSRSNSLEQADGHALRGRGPGRRPLPEDPGQSRRRPHGSRQCRPPTWDSDRFMFQLWILFFI